MQMKEEDWTQQQGEYNGYCKACDDITCFGEVEPDARRYKCDVCDKNTVYGVEEAFMKGWIEIV